MKNKNEMFADLPEQISKEQLCKICHISKATGLYLLESGLINCIDTGKKTHRFIISKKDVIYYLKERERNAQKYKAPELWYSNAFERSGATKFAAADFNPSNLRAFYEQKLRSFDELMTATQIQLFTGYAKEAVCSWINNGHLKYLDCMCGKKIPKEWFLDFLCSDWFNATKRKTVLHRHYIGKANK